MRKIKILSMLITLIMLLLLICPIVVFAVESDTVTVEFEDSKLAGLVYYNIINNNGVTSEEVTISEKVLTIKKDALNNVTLIDSMVKQSGIDNCGFTSLAGLEKFVNLESLKLNVSSSDNPNSYSDLTPLKNLTKLKELNLFCDKINSLIDLKNLTNIEDLRVSSPLITSLEGIENMKLKTISVENAKISDISQLKNSKDTLTHIYVYDNQIKDISILKDFGQLKLIRIANNEVQSLDGILDKESLTTVYADNNKINCIGKLGASVSRVEMKKQVIEQPVSLKNQSDKVTVDLPEILTVLVDESHKFYQGKPSDVFDIESGSLSSDGKKITAAVADIKAGKVKITVKLGENNKYTAYNTVVTFKEAFEVIDVKKEPETENADKVKVTITVNKELDSKKIPDGWTLSEDKKSISKEFDKNGKEDVTLTDKDGNKIKQPVEVSNIKDEKEEFKVINKTEDKQENGKIKVTITTNKELDTNKIPDGWNLNEDGKSIWKIMDKGASEDITLVAKDGSTIKYTVKAGDTTIAPEKIPQTGIKNTIIFVVAGIAIVGTVVFIRSRKMLK